MITARWLIIVLVILLSAGSCKGYREFREARKQLKAERAEREEQAQNSEENVAEPATQEEDHFPDSLFFAMQRTPCFGHCPTYTVNIYQSGYATYSGEANVPLIGEYEAHISPAIADSIHQNAQRIGFMMLLDSYDNSLVTDLPSTLFKLNIGGQKKMVKCRVECPERLMKFTQQTDSLIHTLPWKSR